MKIYYFVIFLVITQFIACNEEAPEQAPAPSKPIIAEAPAPGADSIRKFLISREGTYGWQTTVDDTSYDFFPDGRLHIQGAEGEATMWEGKWTLNQNQLNMKCSEIHKDETLTVKIEGEHLKLGNRLYTRYKPL